MHKEAKHLDKTLLTIWGKVDKASGKAHPLIYHMAETAAVAGLLWDEILGTGARSVMASAMGLTDEAARKWAVLLVGIHDLGKATPSFQSKWPEAVPKLNALGYRFEGNAAPVVHGRATAITLAPILKERGIENKVANELAKLIGGHHGVFDTARALAEKSPRAIGEGSWERTRRRIVDDFAEELQVEGIPIKQELAGLTLLAGLTTVADWIASSAAHFPYRDAGGSRAATLGDLLEESRVKADAALGKLGWRAKLGQPDSLDFRRMFGIATPRPLQATSIAMNEWLELPAMVIIEAPMGEGKTEAALYLAEGQRQKYELRGSYFALPTQATSNQMFGRVMEAMKAGVDTGVAHLLLMHGHAALSAEFEELKRGEFQPTSIGSDDGGGVEIAAGEWFTHRKRGLLAPFGVGTVDQVLMAALQSKHVFVRLLGLSSKVVVIDEVHAYDTYMSALLERLVAWLRVIGSSVVMLSATLPAGRRKALIEAFGGEEKEAAPVAGYPCTTVVSRSGTRTLEFAAASRERTIELESAPSRAADLARWLAYRLRDGGCAAAVCNTVGMAQELFAACKEEMPGQCEDGGPVVDLLHSRFPFEDREAREKRTLARFGKPGRSKRPRKAVLVATQVIEQSLDIDFDLMVTELAPLDLVLQRVGRLYRHERGERPCGRYPTLGIVETELSGEGAPEFPSGNKRVYEEHILLRSWMMLRGLTALHLPGEIRPLIEGVYAEECPPPAEGTLRKVWVESAARMKERRQRDLREAESRYLPHPHSGVRLDKLTAMGRDDDEDLHPFFQALTRLSERTVTVVCLFGKGKDVYLDRGQTKPVPLRDRVSLSVAAEILKRSCSVGDRRVVERLEEVVVPAEWRKSALLRNCRPVVFDEGGNADFGKWRLHLSEECGLRVEECEP